MQRLELDALDAQARQAACLRRGGARFLAQTRQQCAKICFIIRHAIPNVIVF
jgi:hypothetical protein